MTATQLREKISPLLPEGYRKYNRCDLLIEHKDTDFDIMLKIMVIRKKETVGVTFYNNGGKTIVDFFMISEQDISSLISQLKSVFSAKSILEMNTEASRLPKRITDKLTGISIK